MVLLLRGALMVAWALLVIGKMSADPARSEFPVWLLVTASGTEAAIAAMLMSRWYRVGCWVGILFCVIAMVVAWLEPAQVCACVAGLPSSGMMRYSVAAVLGAACSLVLAVTQQHRVMPYASKSICPAQG